MEMVEDLRYLPIGQPLEITQLIDVRELRQRGECPRDASRDSARRARRPASRSLVDHRPLQSSSGTRLRAEGTPARGTLACAVGRRVHDDAEETRVERRLARKRRQRLPGSDERFWVTSEGLGDPARR